MPRAVRMLLELECCQHHVPPSLEQGFTHGTRLRAPFLTGILRQPGVEGLGSALFPTPNPTSPGGCRLPDTFSITSQPKIHPGDSHPPHLLATAASSSIALANFPAFSPKVGKAGQIPSSRCRARRKWQSSTAMGQRIPWIALFSVGSPSSEREKGSMSSCLEKGKTPAVNWDPVWNSFPASLVGDGSSWLGKRSRL